MPLETGEIRVNVRHRYWVPLVVIASIFSVALHFYRAHGEAFQFASQAIRKSAAIQRRIGDVQEIRLGILESLPWCHRDPSMRGPASQVRFSSPGRSTDLMPLEDIVRLRCSLG